MRFGCVFVVQLLRQLNKKSQKQRYIQFLLPFTHYLKIAILLYWNNFFEKIEIFAKNKLENVLLIEMYIFKIHK